jgi:hypothetical protein
MDTYKSGVEALADKQAHQALLTALGAAPRSLRKDACGAWRITGNSGHIYARGDGESFALYVASGSAIKWTYDKKRLSFCQVTQNGDDEGVLRLHGLPSPEQAAAIRSTLGIPKRVAYSPKVLAAKRERLASASAKRSKASTVRGTYGEISPLEGLGVQSPIEKLATVSEAERAALVGAPGE